jgi:hypothetical protein
MKQPEPTGASPPGRGRSTAAAVSLVPKLNHGFYINQSPKHHPTYYTPSNQTAKATGIITLHRSGMI